MNLKMLEILSLMAKDKAKEEEEFSCKKTSVWLSFGWALSVWLSFGWARMIAAEGRRQSVKSAEAAREISHREIGVLKVVRTGILKVSKSRHNRDRPFGRTRGSDRAPPGEAQQEASSENRESEFHESREQLHHTSRNRDTRFPDKADSVWATLEDRWQVKGREPLEDQCIGNRQVGIP
jgi:hypothetical protein